ncbi:MAG: hypothetical protein GY810_32020 [Aureispira sp.]|nr:hypothetical protein [Aureispira sp.]
MKKFMVIYSAPAKTPEQMTQVSKEDHAKVMEAWMAWKGKHEANIVDFGAPLMPGEAVNKSGEWTAANPTTSGYSVLQGNSAEEVKALFNDHPHLGWDPSAAIEVYECVAM